MSDSEEEAKLHVVQIGESTYIKGGKYGPVWRLKPESTPPAPPTNPGPALPPDPAALHTRIDTLQAELNTTNRVNANLAASVTRLQAELNTATSVNTNLAASVTRLQAELDTTTSTNTNIAASVTRLKAELENLTTVVTQLVTSVASLVQPEQVTPTPTTTPTKPSTPTATTDPLPCPPDPQHPQTIASGRGAASPEVFQKIIKTNWHGRLGRAHMVDVDALPASALMELDCLLRRRLHASTPHCGNYSTPEPDITFASLAALGLRLEDRGDYADLPYEIDDSLRTGSMIRRVRNLAAWYYSHQKHVDYWKGFAWETLIELARYRGLFDDEGFLRKDS